MICKNGVFAWIVFWRMVRSAMGMTGDSHSSAPSSLLGWGAEVHLFLGAHRVDKIHTAVIRRSEWLCVWFTSLKAFPCCTDFRPINATVSPQHGTAAPEIEVAWPLCFCVVGGLFEASV